MFNQGKEILAEWKTVNDHLSSLFQQRKAKDAKEPMVKYVELYKKCLYALNGQPLDQVPSMTLEIIQNFKYQPFNVYERLEFIESFPTKYHSFIQLNELYKETEKIYAKAEILEKKKNI